MCFIIIYSKIMIIVDTVKHTYTLKISCKTLLSRIVNWKSVALNKLKQH